MFSLFASCKSLDHNCKYSVDLIFTLVNLNHNKFLCKNHLPWLSTLSEDHYGQCMNRILVKVSNKTWYLSQQTFISISIDITKSSHCMTKSTIKYAALQYRVPWQGSLLKSTQLKSSTSIQNHLNKKEIWFLEKTTILHNDTMKKQSIKNLNIDQQFYNEPPCSWGFFRLITCELKTDLFNFKTPDTPGFKARVESLTCVLQQIRQIHLLCDTFCLTFLHLTEFSKCSPC